MSFFDKVVFKTFLFLALFCFFTSSVFADKTLKYYQTNITGTCTTDKDSACSNHLSHLSSLYTNTTFNLVSCNLSGTTIDIKYSKVVIEMQGNPPKATPVTYPSDGQYRPVGSQLSKVCADNEKLELNGCTATCVVDPCKQLQGLEFTKSDVQCGTASCPSNSIFEVSGTQAYCKPGTAFASPRAAQTAVDPSTLCSGTLADGALSGFKVKTSDAVGKSSTMLYCTATYTNSGSSSLLTPDETGLNSLSFMDVTETTEDGPCPPNTTKGSYAIGENGATKWICYPDSGSPPTDPTDPQTCPTGQHKDAQGVCVSDTTNCPQGQHLGAGGGCFPDSNTGGDGDGGNNSGGGGGGGGSGGSGGNPPNIDNTKGEAGSGSQTGAGGKATASTAEGCGTPPSCSGDPLQCAAFVQDWKQNCQMMSVSQGDADRANALAKASNDEHKAQITAQDQKVTGFFGDFKNTANASLSSGQCPDNVNLSVMGKQMTIKFSDSCFFWRLLRALVIVSAYLAAASIVFRSLA